MPRIKGKRYEDDPFCAHGYDEGCPVCDVDPEPLAPAVARQLEGRKARGPRDYREWADRMAPVDDGAADNYGGW